jgi:peptide/nickel transport system substrate-binding protein
MDMTLRDSLNAAARNLSRRQALALGATGGALLAAPRAGWTQARPRQGGHLIAAQEQDPISLDNHKTSNYSSVQGVEHIVESLTQYDDKMNVRPCLAESWTTPDPVTYVFNLRRGVTFHDGTELVADDVVAWWDRISDSATAAPYRSWFTAIEGVQAVDKHTVKMSLKNPFGPLLASFAALRGSAIIPRTLAQDRGNLGAKAVGTGPFRLSRFVPYDHLHYVRNEKYWDKGFPHVNEFTFKVMVEEDARVAALRAGQIHYAYLTGEGAARLKDDKNITVLRSPRAFLMIHVLNSTRKPFSDKRVRQAISLAADRQDVLQKAGFGEGSLSGPVPTGHTDWWIPLDKLPYKQDIARAKQLLAEAGYPNGFETTIKASPQYPEFISASVAFQSHLKRIGINAKIIQLEWGQFIKETFTQRPADYDMKVTAWTFYPDPHHYLYNWWSSKSPSNQDFKSAELDQILDKAMASTDREERKRLYVQAQQILLDEAPQIIWYTGHNIEAVRNDVKGYFQSYTGRRIAFKRTWLEA